MIKKSKVNRSNAYYKMPKTTKKRKKGGMFYQVGHISANPHLRLYFLLFFVFIIFCIIIFRLFYLQIIRGEYYTQKAYEQQYSKIVIPASRGEILASNSKNGETQKLATNVSLDLVYIDPTYIPDKAKVAKQLAPILFGEEDYINCKNNIKLCPSGRAISFEDNVTLSDNPTQGTGSEFAKDNRSMEQLINDYSEDILERISKVYNDFLPLKYGALDEEIDEIVKANLVGVRVNKKDKLIYADPTQIPSSSISNHARVINKILPDNSISFLKRNLNKRKIQYIPLKRKIKPETSEAVMKLKLESYEQFQKSGGKIPHYYKGVVLLKEHWRYYPENSLASQIIGFVDNDGIGRYGIEEQFNTSLRGKDGIIFNRKNIRGEFVFFDKNDVSDAIDGDTYVLTIDKAIQQKAEELLKHGVEITNADGGEIIVMDPKTGYILASVNYPTYDPNKYGEVYKISPIKEFIPPPDEYIGSLVKPQSKEEGTRLYYTKPVFVKDEKGNLIDFYADDAKKENEEILEAEKNGDLIERKQKYMYENGFGLRNYINNNFMSTYEPGSVFKSIVIAIGLDAKEIDPSTTYEEFGPIEIDTGTSEKQLIRTAEGVYRGIQTVSNAIEHSSNIGLAFVARKLGRQLFYDYLFDFNFGEIYEIELPGERSGYLEYWKKWNEAKLLTTSFGQGVAVTPLQMANAYCALANGGKLMKPILIKKKIGPDGKEDEYYPKVLKSAISEKASAQITSILVSSVEVGAASAGGVKGYKVAGKTGTAQMSCTDSRRCIIGRYEPKLEGHFITSYGGYAPAEDPRFVIIVKINRARMGPKTFGSNTAAPIFSKLSEFLLHYYGIAPTS